MRNWPGVALAVVAVGCATPYQRMGVIGGGYANELVGPREFLVRFRGNGYTSMGLTYQYVLRRAHEICPTGYDVLDQMGSAQTSSFFSWTSGSLLAFSETSPETAARVRCHGEPSAAALAPPPPYVEPVYQGPPEH